MKHNATDATTWAAATRLVHAGSEANETSAITVPIYQSSTFRFDSAEQGAELCDAIHPSHLYTRWGNPTTRALELALADVEGGEAALAFSSGMAAGVTAVMAMVRGGDHVIAANCLYAGMTELFDRVLRPLGVDTTFVDPEEDGAFEQALRPETKLIYVETPANPTLAITGLAAVAELARDRGVFTIADNTWASPWNTRPLELGIDAVIHSATKYLGGHSDLIAGAVLGSKDLMGKVAGMRTVLGSMATPMNSWLMMRSLETLDLRMRRETASAERIAAFLATHPKVAEVSYLGLLREGDPGYDIYQEQAEGPGAMISFWIDGGEEEAFRFIDSLNLIHLAVSLGSTETLVEHPATMTHTGVDPDEKKKLRVNGSLVRLSIGVENPDDLIHDISNAFDAI